MAVDAVLLDAGGVLLLPTPEIIAPPLRAAGADPGLEKQRRAHYRAIGAMDAGGAFDWGTYRRTYAAECGVAPERVDEAARGMEKVFSAHTWMRPAPGAVDTLRRIGDGGVAMGIVSNAAGTIADMLSAAGVCQLGSGPCAEVAVIADSEIVGIEKPAAGIFAHALDALGVEPDRAVHVGDTARSDVDGAIAAGVRPLHLDPYGDCPDRPGDHEHIRELDDLLTLIQ